VAAVTALDPDLFHARRTAFVQDWVRHFREYRERVARSDGDELLAVQLWRHYRVGFLESAAVAADLSDGELSQQEALLAAASAVYEAVYTHAAGAGAASARPSLSFCWAVAGPELNDLKVRAVRLRGRDQA
jgi:hypothetical protein